MTPLSLSLTLALVFVAVGLTAGLATSAFLSTTATERRRLWAATKPAALTPLPEALSITGDTADGWQHATKLLGYAGKGFHKLRVRLARAGFRHPAAPFVYAFVEHVVPLIVGALPLLVLSGPIAWFAAISSAGAVFFAPGLLVERRLALRRRDIENGLPDALDLMVVCIEAGSGIDQALVKTSDELAIAYPTLADELRILIAEIRAGKPRLDAFKSLAQRTKVDDVRALVATLLQTDRFGTSVGQALRTHADVSRTKRRQRAEEKAQKLGVKLVFPLVFCFFPAFYVVVIGPAVLQFIRVFMTK